MIRAMIAIVSILFLHLPCFNSQFSLEDLAKDAEIAWIRAEHALDKASKRQQASRSQRRHPKNSPPPPSLPFTFKAKGRARVQYKYDGDAPRDLLAIYHYSYPLRKTRLDVYYVQDQNITRYFTDIRDYTTNLKYMIFHRIKHQSLSSPHSCLIAPLKSSMLHPRVLHDRGRWLGQTNTSIDVGNVSLAVPTNQWEITQSVDDDAVNDDVWHYFSSVTNNEPVRLVRHEKNVDVHFIDFQPVVAGHPPGMFEYNRVSQVKCAKYKGKHRL